MCLEQNTLTSGSTWHAAGLVTHIKHSEAMIAMVKYSRDLFARLEASETDQVGWHQTGTLGLARGEEHWEQLRRTTTLLEYNGVPHEIFDLSGPSADSEARRLLSVHPLLELAGVSGAILTPTDGIVNPVDATMASVRMAREKGVVFVENCGVASLLMRESGSLGMLDAVVTTCGATIKAGSAVLACGQWTRELAAQAGIVVPTAIVPHQFAVFDKTEGASNALPIVRDYCNHMYVKPEVGGFAVGVFELPHTDMPAEVEARNATGARRAAARGGRLVWARAPLHSTIRGLLAPPLLAPRPSPLAPRPALRDSYPS